MIPTFVGEHKADIGLAALGGSLGMYVGHKAYEYTPSKMVRYVPEKGKMKPYITDRFIKYAEKVSLKDLYANIDVHTERAYVNHIREVIVKNASRAKSNPKCGERWQFQKIYDLGIKYITNRKEVPIDDMGLAKRGANAIQYGRGVERRNHMIAGALMLGTAAVAIKKGVEKFIEYKNNRSN